MIVVHFELTEYSHGCWGERESFTSTQVQEFATIEEWLKYRQDKNVKFIALYEVSKVIRECDN